MNNRKSINKKPHQAGNDNYLLHQLQLHQMELEIQNDELRMANEQLELQQLKFAGIYDLAPIGYFILDKEGLVTEVNNAGVAMLMAAKRKIIGNRLHGFIAADHTDH